MNADTQTNLTMDNNEQANGQLESQQGFPNVDSSTEDVADAVTEPSSNEETSSQQEADGTTSFDGHNLDFQSQHDVEDMSVQERADLEFALALQNDDQPDTAANAEQEGRELTAQELFDLEIAIALQNEEDHQDATNGVADQDAPPETHECACGEVYNWREFTNVVWLECGHVRCPPCFNENVRVGLEAKKNFPPRCCPGIPINIELYQAYLERDVKQRYEAVKPEYTDIAPVHCATKTCSAYLPKATITPDFRWAVCSACTAFNSIDSISSQLAELVSLPKSAPTPTPTSPPEVRTCTACLHLETDHDPSTPSICPERIDRVDKDLFTKEGWKSCPNCQEMIEKSDGCDHMQCDCGHEFCYQCGRSYTGGMPCNCHGNNAWVDDVDEEENDPDVQRQILEGIGGWNGNVGDDDEEEEEDDHLGDQPTEDAGDEVAEPQGGDDGDANDGSGDDMPHAAFAPAFRGGFGRGRGNFRGRGDVLGHGRGRGRGEGRGRGRGWGEPHPAPNEGW